jgi:hypothetical protein
VSYIAAGYGIAIGALGIYAVSLVRRRRRLERLAERVEGRPT